MKQRLITATLLLFSIGLFAQDNAIKGMEDFLNQVDTMHVPDTFKLSITKLGVGTDTTNKYMNETVFWYTFNQNRKVFQWQYVSSIIIFFVVMLIVLTGLYLSYLQFKMTSQILTRKTVKVEGADATAVPGVDAGVMEMSKTNLEVGKDGIKINSAVIGLIILTLSLSFLFLYLKYVYPVNLVKTHL